MHDVNNLEGLRVGLASPEQVRAWSWGEVTRAETVNYRTYQPVPGGLLCERIFGPLKDWTCACGKYRRRRLPGFVCEVCGVEITRSRVRRERMGHIELVVPIVHPWFARGGKSMLSLLLDLSPRQLSAVLAYHGYLVTEVHETRRAEALRTFGVSSEPSRNSSSIWRGWQEERS